MLMHLSMTFLDPPRVARVLAELLDASVVDCPTPPFPPGSKYVCCFDAVGTMVELLPAGTSYEPSATGNPRAICGPVSDDIRSGVHGLFTTQRTYDEIRNIAAREGWLCTLVDTGRFKVIALWLEGTQLIELAPPDLVQDYLALYGTGGRESLEPFLREVESHLRSRSPANTSG